MGVRHITRQIFSDNGLRRMLHVSIKTKFNIYALFNAYIVLSCVFPN